MARILKTLHWVKRKGLGVWGWEGISPPCSQENPGSVGTQLAHLSCRGRSLCRFSTPQLTSGFTPSLPRPLAPLQDTVLCGPHTRLSLPFTVSEAKTGPAMGLDCEGGCAFLSRTAEGPASPLLPSPQRPRLITPGIGGSDLPGVHALPKKSGPGGWLGFCSPLSEGLEGQGKEWIWQKKKKKNGSGKAVSKKASPRCWEGRSAVSNVVYAAQGSKWVRQCLLGQTVLSTRQMHRWTTPALDPAQPSSRALT